MNGTLSPALSLTFSGAPLSHRRTSAHILRAKQNRAITPQDSDIADLRSQHRLSTTPGSSPAGAEKDAMPATTATSSPSARGGALAWLRAMWRVLLASPRQAVQPISDDVPRIAQHLRGELRGFREFTAPRRMQLGAATPMRARAVGQRISLRRGRA